MLPRNCQIITFSYLNITPIIEIITIMRAQKGLIVELEVATLSVHYVLAKNTIFVSEHKNILI